MSNLINDIKVTSPYGDRVLNGKKQFHDGIDFKSTSGDRRVFNLGDGYCVFDFDDYDDRKRWKDPKHSGGNYTITRVKIGKKEYYVKYLHLVANYISKGEKLVDGQHIGLYADVGYSFGEHLHLNIYNLKWEPIDPTPILKEMGVI